MNRRGSALLVLIIVAGILVVGGGFWYLKNFTSTPNSVVPFTSALQVGQSSSNNNVASQSWQTYQDSALMFEFGYPSAWNILISSTTNEEDITLTPVTIDRATITLPSPTISVTYLVTDNQLHSEFFSPNPGGYPVERTQIDRYDGRFYVTTSTGISSQASWFTETIGAYVQRGNRSGMTLKFMRYSTSSNFSVADDTALFKSIVATVKFDSKVSGLADTASQNNDKQKYDAFSIGVANDLLLYYDNHKTFPDGLTALTSYNNQLTKSWEPTSTRTLGQSVASLLNDFSYSVSPDHQSYHMGISLQTTLVVDNGADSDFNSATVGWVNGFDGADTKPCRSSDVGIWCYDLVYSARGAAPLSATSSTMHGKPTPSAGATACDSICITSPADGFTVSPGSMLNVTVTVSPKQSVSFITLQTRIGSSAILTKPPYTFSLSVPVDIQPGAYSISAVARDSSQAMVYSPEISIDVKK